MILTTLAQDAATTTTNTATAVVNEPAFFIWGCVFFGVAMFLLVLELFIPSGGLIGILSGVGAVASIVCFFRYDSTWGVGVSLAYVVLGPILVIFLFRMWVSSSLAKVMILGADQARLGDDPEEATLASEAERRARLEELRALIGATGVTDTALRPVGTVRIEGQRIDALAETGIIEANTPIVVTDVYDNQIKVRPA